VSGAPINLRAARKARARAEKRAAGDANAAKFGQTRAEKAAHAARTEAESRAWEGHRREGPIQQAAPTKPVPTKPVP